MFCRWYTKLRPYGSTFRQTDERRTSIARKSLDPETELFLSVTILRRGFNQQDLAFRLGISQSSVSRIWSTWLHLVYQHLCQVPVWLPKKVIQDNMPSAITEHVPIFRAVFDCTEFFIEMPSSFRAQSETFSQYKHHNTAKALVVVAPHGSVLFASKLYGGRVSDKAIVKDCGILDRFEEGDVILADRGFDIKQLKPVDVTVQMPAFMEDRRQLPASEGRDSRRLASARIHVERVIRRIKVFRILKHTFPLKMKPSLQLIWQVCARFVNFLPPIIAGDDDEPSLFPLDRSVLSPASPPPAPNSSMTAVSASIPRPLMPESLQWGGGQVLWNNRLVHLDNTCAIDNVITFTHLLLTARPDIRDSVQEKLPLLAGVSRDIAQGRWKDAKLSWLTASNVLPNSNGIINVYGSEAERNLTLFAPMCQTSCTSTCDFEQCPSAALTHVSPFPALAVCGAAWKMQDAVDAWLHPPPVLCRMVDNSVHLPMGTIEFAVFDCPGRRIFADRDYSFGSPPFILFSLSGLGVSLAQLDEVLTIKESVSRCSL